MTLLCIIFAVFLVTAVFGMAASTSAKRAAKVSPVTAVTGNLENIKNENGAVNTHFFKIETALSIVLFLSFFVFIEIIGFLIPQSSNTIDMTSYDEYDLDCLTKDSQLRKGSDISKVYGDSNYALTIWDKDSSLEIGDKIEAGAKTLEIAGMLKCNPFSSDGRTNGEITLIALVTVLNIMNNISMSVLARIKQYEAMQAVIRHAYHRSF